MTFAIKKARKSFSCRYTRWAKHGPTLVHNLYINIFRKFSAVRMVFQSLSQILFAKQSIVFTALHVMQTRYCDEISVRPSVTRVNCDKTVERSVQIYIPYERTFILVFGEDRTVGGGRPLLREILGQPTPIGTKSPGLRPSTTLSRINNDIITTTTTFVYVWFDRSKVC